jgi:LPXTG-site transpeptidase (sortase) family protein
MLMKRVFSAVGTLMVVAGAGLLTYVLVQYHNQSSTTAKSPHWSAAQAKKGREIAAQFAKHQIVKVPVLNKRVDVGSEPALRMTIPRIGLDSPVVQTPPVNGVWDVADWRVGHLSTTPNPGAPGNAAFSAHDDIKGEIFKRVNELTPGSQIILKTMHASFTYIVTGQQVVDPSNTAPLNPTKASTITLISCTPYWVDTQRLIVRAVLKSSTAT